jgi:arylsulfatase A-like enzyme
MTSKTPSRREILKGAAVVSAAALLSRWSKLTAADAPAVVTDSKTGGPSKLNVLFLMSDDMRPELSCYGNPINPTPNVAALAKAGIMFERGYCQYPLCNPSRTSMLTGHQVINTGVSDNTAGSFFWTKHPDWVSLPKYFKQHGYVTARTGKIFHFDDGPAWSEGGQAGGADPSEAFDIPIPNPAANVYGQAAPAASAPAAASASDAAPDVNEIMRYNRQVSASAGKTKAGYSDQIVMLEGDGQGHGDYNTADRAIEYLQKYKDQPFFIGCGFVKPHSPPTAPKKYFDMLPIEKIQLPVDFAPSRTVPAGFPEGCLRPKNADLFIGRDATPEQAKQVIQAYYASVAWTDWNIGRVIAELDRLGLREKTIICFVADHGYQLGEKGKWSKAGSLWEEGARVPYILAHPKVKGNGQVCQRIVEELNIYPTLLELCDLPKADGQEGRSMVSLLDNPKAEWDRPAYTVWRESGDSLTGIGVRVERWRYADYVLGGPMLLDMENDPHQLKNLAHDPRYAEVTQKMADLVTQYKNGDAPKAKAPIFAGPFAPGAAPLPALPTPAPA